MTNLASKVSWGAGYAPPTINVSFDYEYRRSGGDMEYRVYVKIHPVSGQRYFGYPIYLSLSLDGTERAAATVKSASPSQWTGDITYASGWLTLKGKTTGTAALGIRLYSGLGSGRTQTYTYALGVSPAASEVSAQAGVIGSPLNIVISKADPAFTHTLSYAFFGENGTIAEKTAAGAVVWIPPVSLCSRIPEDEYGECTITCRTYSGDTAVGEKSCAIRLNVPAGAGLKVSPGWAGIAPYNAGTAARDINAWVQGYSRGLVTFDPGKISTKDSLGAGIASYKIVCGAAEAVSPPYLTGVLNTPGDIPVTCTVYDTRGRAVSETLSVHVNPYAKPALSDVTAARCNIGGAPEDSGTYIYVKAGASYSGLGGANTVRLQARYRTRDGTYGEYISLAPGEGAVIGGGGVEINTTYVAEITATDALGERDVNTVYIPTASVAFNIRDGGHGAAFFKYAEKDGILEVDGGIEVRDGIKSGKLTPGKLLKYSDKGIVPAVEGTDYVKALEYPLPVSKGGTGGTTEADARENLGVVFANVARLQAYSQTENGWILDFQAVDGLSRQQRVGFDKTGGIYAYSNGDLVWNMRPFGFKRENVVFASDGIGAMACPGVSAGSAIFAMRNSSHNSGARDIYPIAEAWCEAAGTVKMMLSDPMGATIPVTVFWSK